MSADMEYRDYYQALGVPRDADPDAIKRAYRKLARRYHPDVSKEADAEERFKALSEAYEVLKDPEKRAAYDQFGENWQQGQSFETPPNWHRSHDFGSATGGNGGQFSDFFDSLFGGFNGTAQAGYGPTNRGNVEADLRISIEDAYQGSSRTITLTLPQHSGPGAAAGAGSNKTLNVKIPKGIRAGQRIRLEGQASNGGDVLLNVQFLPHPTFSTDGKDILVTVPVLPWQAALGQAVTIPTLGGEVSMKVPAGVRSGQRLRLKGRGLPGSPAGDQYAIIELVVPAAQNDEIRDLYQALEKANKHNAP